MLECSRSPHRFCNMPDASGGCTRGRQPSCGGSRQHRCVPALFAGARRASGVGGTIPAPACPWGKRERGIRFLAAAGHFGRCSTRRSAFRKSIAATTRCRASIRTLNEPLWARCMLRSDFKPRSFTNGTNLGCWVLPSSYRSLDGPTDNTQSPEQGGG
jgi:hypothetical protein